MASEEKLCFTNCREWRAWLKKNYKKKKEVWLVYYKKATGKPTIPYDDAVEEALCFGWIDGKLRRIDDEKHMQRYMPRNPKSIWSQSNIRREKKMIKEGKMTKDGLEKFKLRKHEKTEKKFYPIPEDLKTALSKNKAAGENFGKFAPSYKKQYIWWIESAKMKETRKRRIKEVVRRAAINKKPGIS